MWVKGGNAKSMIAPIRGAPIDVCVWGRYI